MWVFLFGIRWHDIGSCWGWFSWSSEYGTLLLFVKSGSRFLFCHYLYLGYLKVQISIMTCFWNVCKVYGGIAIFWIESLNLNERCGIGLIDSFRCIQDSCICNNCILNMCILFGMVPKLSETVLVLPIGNLKGNWVGKPSSWTKAGLWFICQVWTWVFKHKLFLQKFGKIRYWTVGVLSCLYGGKKWLTWVDCSS